MRHGLFGRLEPGGIQEFGDWKDIARLVYANSRKNITMYRSIVSFTEEVTVELMLKNQKSWQRYIENHIITIAEKNHIRREHFQWAVAIHNERGHPHAHIVFWDTSCRAKNPFTPPAIPNAIRKQMIKDTFPDKIRAYGQQKDMAVSSLRKISDDLVYDFEKHIRLLDKNKYRELRSVYDEEEELLYNLDFDDAALNEIADRVFRIKSALPQKGRIAYQLLLPEVKELVDSLVKYILDNHPSIRNLMEKYVQSKLNLTKLYSSDADYLEKMAEKFGREAEKIVANRILGMVKSLNRLDYEIKSEDYIKSRREYYSAQILYEIMDMLTMITIRNNDERDHLITALRGELSKEAKRELYLKYQDKGYEH